MRLAALTLLLATACSIDSSKLDAIKCAGSCGAPDLECVDGYCLARDCGDFRDCGVDFQYVCEDAKCRAVGCNSDSNCAGGFECVDGFCAAEECGEQEDEDFDGFTGLACGGPDCDDHDRDVNPDASEGGGGESDPTCGDGIDNDCDGREDTSDDACGPCVDDSGCNDDNPCTVDHCTRGDCTFEPSDGTACDDGDPCTRNDQCEVVVCRGEGFSCDDGLDCTADECDGNGGCTSTPAAGSCFVDGACFEDGDASPDDPCLVCDIARATDALSPAGDGTACDDGDDCTDGDTCDGGTCTGVGLGCDDGLDCTVDSCDGLGGCTVEVEAGSCAIDGACWQDGDPQPGNGCLACDAGADALAWSDAALGPDDGLACTTDACVAGVETHTPNDGLCGGGQVCAPCAGTANGCALAPSALTLGCDATAGLGGAGADCTLDVTGAVGADECLSCETLLGITPLVREDMTGCPDLSARGWSVAGAPTCPTADGDDALQAEESTFTLGRRFDTTGLDRLRLCFDVADRGADLDDLVTVRVDSDGSFDVVHQDAGGPVAAADGLWVTTCLDLDVLEPSSTDNPDVGIEVELVAAGAGDELFVDGIVLEGWTAGTVTSGVLVSNNFAACALGGWTASGDPIVCPAFARDALGANEASWAIAQTVDAGGVCEDLTVAFSIAGQNALAADTATLTWDAGAGMATAWSSAGQPDGAGAFRALTVNLSHLDPTVRFTDGVDLDFAVDASTVGATLALDDVTVRGSTCSSGAGVVDATAPSRAGLGSYDVAVTSSARTRAHVVCTWSGQPVSAARAVIDFLP